MNHKQCTGESKAEAPILEKHAQLLGALQALDNLENSLGGFVDKVRGEDSPKQNSQEFTNASLSQALNMAPEYIHSLCDRMHSLIGNLNNELF